MPTKIRPPERGVYTCSFYDRMGNTCKVAISSTGCCIAWVPFTAETEADVVRELSAMLNHADPVVRLRAI